MTTETVEPQVEQPTTEAEEPDPLAAKVLREIQLKADEVSSARRDYEEKHAVAQIAKKRVEALQEELEKLIRASKTEMPLYDAKPADEEDWRTVPLIELGLAETLIERLAEADLRTVGELADYCKDCQLTDIRGVGESKAEKIQQALDQFWTRRAAEAAAQPEVTEESSNGEVEQGSEDAAEPERSAEAEPQDEAEEQDEAQAQGVEDEDDAPPKARFRGQAASFEVDSDDDQD